MISGQGAQLSVTASDIRLHYSPLCASLRGEAPTIAVADVTGVSLVEPTAYLGGHVLLRYAPEGQDETEIAVPFAPQRAAEAREFAEAVEAARRGESIAEGAQPAAPGFAGLTFSAVNIAAANAEQGSICQIGLASVRDGELRSHTQWTCRPPEGLDEFDPRMSAIHGISAEDCEGLPRFAEVWPEVAKAIGSDVLVAHRAQFDLAGLHAAWRASGIPVPELHYGCSHILALHAGLPLTRTRLSDLCEHLGVEAPEHHDAESSAIACARVILALAGLLHPEASQLSVVELFASRGLLLGVSTEDTLYPVLADAFHRADAEASRSAGEESSTPDSRCIASPPDGTGQAGTDFRSGGRSGAKANSTSGRGGGSARRSARWSRVAQPETIPDPNPDADPDGELYGQNVTLSGDFAPYDKGELWEALAERGASIGKNVTKKTTLLVAGPWGKKTSKHKRAEELQEKGQDIRIWTAEELYTALGLNRHVEEEPPF